MDVTAWLKRLGLGQYAEAFADNGITADFLPELTNEDLKDLGVSRLADRKRLLRGIGELSGRGDLGGGRPGSETALLGERRQVTVLFADIAGYTRLASALGAEETHAVLNRYFETVDAIVETYGGRVDKHIGDSVMAVFGAPVAHHDDPMRAVRAACEIHARLESLSREAGHPLSAHLGIASGQVVASGTGSDAHREYTVTGGSVNLAARLQEQAAPRQTLISDAVRRAVADWVECESLGEVAVKGLDAPVPVWRLMALRDPAPSARGALVARRAELAQFSSIVEACRASGAGQAVVVRGEAGIGKTRLVEEFAGIAAEKGFEVHNGQVLDFGAGRDAVRTVVRSLLGIAHDADDAAREAARDKSIAHGPVSAEQRVFLNDLLELPQSLEERAAYDAMDNPARNEGKRRVVAGLVRGASSRSPVLVVIEDVHWAEPLLLAHLARLAATVADCPAILVMTSRIEGDPLDATWRATTEGCPFITIDLGPLRKKDALEMAQAFSDATSHITSECVERAEGNPLFLEQLLRNAAERGEEEVPGSIQSLILARMDRLAPTDKRALQAAAVLGQRFALDALRHLLDEPDYRCDPLVAHYLVRPEGEDYMFAHALIQEGAYSSLLKATRQELHRRAARWFADRDAVLRAEHLDRADDEGAAEAYLDAARAQAALYHYDRAIQLVERGRALAEGTGHEFALTVYHGELLHDAGAVDDSMAAYRHAIDIADDDAARCRAWIGLAAGMRVRDRYDEAFPLLDDAEAAARENRLTLELARIHHLRGNLCFPLAGRLEDCLREHELSRQYAEQCGSPEAEARAFGGLGDAYYALGRMRTAQEYYDRCIALARQHGLGRIEVANLYMRAAARRYRNELKECLQELIAGIDAASQLGHQRAELVGLVASFEPMTDLGETDLLRDSVDRARRLVKRLGARRFEPVILSSEAQLLAECGRRAEASGLLEQAVAISRETGIGFVGPQLLGKLAETTTDPAQRRSALEEGERLLAEGAVSHNHFRYYRFAMEACLAAGEWVEAERYASALEDYARAEPLPWSDFWIARGRALAAFGRGSREETTMEELRRLRDEAARVGIKPALAAIEDALAAA